MSNKQRRNSGKRRFIQLWTNVKRSTAYRGLSLGARAALFEILDKYSGANNGMIPIGVRELAGRLNCSQGGAGNFLNELDDSGLAHPTKLGVWRGRRATEWRLTFYRCDLTGELPVLNWDAWFESTSESAAVQPRERKTSSSPPTKAQKPKSSMNGFGLSPPTDAHVDIPSPSGLTHMQQRARKHAGIPVTGPLPSKSSSRQRVH